MSSLMPVILSQNKQEWGLWIGFFVHWCLFNATRMSQYAQPCWRDVLVLFTLVELLSCALCTWRRSTHAISWADFPPKHKSAVSSLFLSRPPSLSSVSLKYLQSGLQRLSVSFRYFLFFFTCGEKWGVCLFWKILTKGSESFGTGFQSPDSPALVVLSPYRCWANCNYQWEPTLTHLLSKKGILLFGGILMQWLHTANESYPLYQSTTSALSLLLLLLFYQARARSAQRAESARAFTGRRNSHSGRGEDFLTGQPDFFTETSLTLERKVEKSFPMWEINRHAEG